MSEKKPFNVYGSMKKQELINELTKRDERVKRAEDLLQRSANEIDRLEINNASQRMYLIALTDLYRVETGRDEIYVNKTYAFELLQGGYVDFSAADDTNTGVILKIVSVPNVDTQEGVEEIEQSLN